MFVDIHTHKLPSSSVQSVRNISFSEAKNVFSTGQKGLFSVGFHPWSADECSVEKFSQLENWTKNNQVVAIGECGLDKNCKVTFNTQISVFEQQISLSEKIEKPLIIHCVGYFNELFELKKKWNPRQIWMIHGFRGKPELALQAMKSGFSLSYGEHFNPESVCITPVSKLFIETDESKLQIDDIYKKIALIKGCSESELAAGRNLLNNYFANK
jgi:TatD DNase family protein